MLAKNFDPVRRLNSHPAVARASVNQLCAIVGLPVSDAYTEVKSSLCRRRRSFWARHTDLHGLAFDLKEAYLKSAKEVHPDKGGSEEQMKLVNGAWDRLKTILRRKGVDMR